MTNTESVPATLLLRHKLEPNRHVVWFDNLFTTILLLELLRLKGIGAAGTVRTTRTKREDDEGAPAPAPGLESAPTQATRATRATQAPRALARALEQLSKERFDKALTDVKTYHLKNLD